VVSAGEDIEIELRGIAHGGTAVGRAADGRVVFVADAIPGERVVARVTEVKKSFARGEAVDVLDASPHRVAHIWPEASIERDPAERAGGAEFGHIALAHQRELKARVLREALERFSGAGRPAGGAGADDAPAGPESGPMDLKTAMSVEAAPGDDARGGLGWRSRVRLHVDASGRPGPYAARSHRLVPVTRLPLADPRIQASGLLEERFPGEASVEAIAPAPGAGLRDDGIRLIIGRQQPSPIIEGVAFPDGIREFRVDDTGFWQVHREAPALLAAAVRAAIDPARFDPAADNLDLYGGVGLLAAAMLELGGPGTRVTSVESAPRATMHAEANLADFPRASAETARVERWLVAAVREGRDLGGATVVLDPPRSGAGGEATRALASLGAAQLVYVACDPIALARDAATLEGEGYRMTSLRAFDLFPHTHHLEAVASFEPVRRAR